MSYHQTPYIPFAEMASGFGPVRDLCFPHRSFRKTTPFTSTGPRSTPKEQATVKADGCSEGIVTRCRGGNTWSIPRWRNVFISLFTNVAISRCVHFKVRCSTGSPSSAVWLQWGTCAEAGATLFEQLAQFSPACTYARTDLRPLYHTE